MLGTIVSIVLSLIVVIIVLSSIKVVTTGRKLVVERLGQYNRTLEPGWHVLVPFVDYVRANISTKQQVLEIEPQNVITKDNVRISIDNVLFYSIIDPQKAVYSIENYEHGMVYSVITNVRNLVGNMTLDEVLSGRDKINTNLLTVVDSVTEPWGIKVRVVEIKDIVPPKEIQEAMEKQMKAEREKRATILQAEGEREAAKAVAEGQQAAQVLAAEGEKQAAILRAEASKQSQTLEADGKAKAIRTIADATAEATRTVNGAVAASAQDPVVLAWKQAEVYAAVGTSPSAKLVIPAPSVATLSSVAAVGEAFRGPGEPKDANK